VITLNYDKSAKKFRGPLGPDILESDFDITDFVGGLGMAGFDKPTIKSPKRNRPTAA
jgi:hypothetical protein